MVDRAKITKFGECSRRRVHLLFEKNESLSTLEGRGCDEIQFAMDPLSRLL